MRANGMPGCMPPSEHGEDHRRRPAGEDRASRNLGHRPVFAADPGPGVGEAEGSGDDPEAAEAVAEGRAGRTRPDRGEVSIVTACG
jgi:hypothetical protein